MAIHLNTKLAAIAIGVSPRTMESWRMKKIGPNFIKLSRLVLYSQEEIDRFIEMRTVELKKPPAQGQG